MHEYRRERLERRRVPWVVGIVALAFATFLGGPVLALLLGSVIFLLVFTLGFELSRPVTKDPTWDLAWAVLIYTSAFAFIPGIALVGYLTGPGVEQAVR